MLTRSRKRKLAAIEAAALASAPGLAAAEDPIPKSAVEDQETPLAGSDGGAVDRISQLPDGVLGDIVSLLPTKEGARTQILARRWRHIWRSAPLNLDHLWLCRDRKDLDAVVSCILSAHPGPGRRFSAPVYHLVGDRAATADTWLRSPSLDGLQELDLCSFNGRLPFPPLTWSPPPAAVFRFSETLSVATIGECHLPDSTAQVRQFPKLKKLELERVSISESSLNTMIVACPALESLLIQSSSGFHCLRINSMNLRSIGGRFEKLIIENAPCLERLIQLGSRNPHLSVISAPKLETLGCLDSTSIEALRVRSLTITVKILAINHMDALSLDVVIDLMRCFPCLEKFYIESVGHVGPGKTNLRRCKYKSLTSSLDIRLKIIVWRHYRGNKAHADFATFFILNARALELLTLHVNQEDYNENFFGQQRKILQLDSKASKSAKIHFTPNDSYRYDMDFRLHDLDLADPFERKDPCDFFALL